MTKETDYEVDEGNIFAAIGRKDADELVARSELLDDVGNLIEKSGLTKHEVAKKLGCKGNYSHRPPSSGDGKN